MAGSCTTTTRVRFNLRVPLESSIDRECLGINPLQQIWTAAVNAGLSRDALNTAHNAVNAEAAAVASQLRGLHSNGALAAYVLSSDASLDQADTLEDSCSKTNTADFVLVGIPPLEVSPSLYPRSFRRSVALS